MTLTIERRAVDTTFAVPPCAGRTDLFFSTVHAEIQEAKRVCAACASTTRCKDLAIAHAEPCGVWGGETFENGLPVHKRPPGRPRTRALTAGPNRRRRGPSTVRA